MNIADLSHFCYAVKNNSEIAPLINRIKDSALVCLGDASHGTHEFYEWRMKITLELIRNHGFHFVAFEGDWPDFENINNHLTGLTEHPTETLLYQTFRRWPSWMWANHEMANFIEQVRSFNQQLPLEDRIRFHGLDVYSVRDSAQKTLNILDEIDPDLGTQAPVLSLDLEHSERFLHWLKHLKIPNDDANTRWKLFDALQNAKVVRNGLRFSDATGIGEDRSWNIRDRHMLETLKSLFTYYGRGSKGIVWAHINHVSDIRKEVGKASLSLGGLAKDAFGENNVSLVAFMTYRGTVIASPRWEGPIMVMNVPPARLNSMESLFHDISRVRKASNLFIIFDQNSRQFLDEPTLYRYVAVVYNPKEERQDNYVYGYLPDRFDALFFIDESNALEPITGLKKDKKTEPKASP